MASRKLINKVKYSRFLYTIYFYVGSLFVNIVKIFLKSEKQLISFSCYSGKSYDDSPKAIYEAMLLDPRFKDCNIVWDFREPEKFEIRRGSKIKTDTFKYFQTVLKARVWVTNVSKTRGLQFNGINTVVLNTWHGSAIKKLGIDINKNSGRFKSRAKVKLGDILLAQGQFDVDIFSHAFNVNKDNIFAFGFPRNDELAQKHSDNEISDLKQRIGIPKGKKVILYAPTYRDFVRNSDGCVMDFPLDLHRWSNVLGKEYVFLLRGHHEVVDGLKIKSDDFVINVSDYPSINELMIVSDMLISDYSSIFFDYSIQDKPMICFAYDYETYAMRRGVYFDIRKELDSLNINSEDALLEAIRNMDIESRIKATTRFREKYVQEYGNASKKCLDEIYKIITS